MLIIWIGALFFICGIQFLAWTAIFRGELSSTPARTPGDPSGTLEPDRRGLRFLGVSANWPGLVLLAVGPLMMLWA